MHNFAARRGMVASSGFRRIHSFSTFTARADLAKGDYFGETQKFLMEPNTKAFPEGFWLGNLLMRFFNLEPKLRTATTRVWGS